MNVRTITPGALTGSLAVPPSKSYAHRALLCAALAGGQSVVRNLELSQDIRATVDAIVALGADVRIGLDSEGHLQAIVQGTRGCGDLPQIDCGESGSTLRFLLPLALTIAGGGRFTGTQRLAQRSLEPYMKLFAEQGISIERGAGSWPLTLKGRLKPGRYALSGATSSQFITGLLLALPMLDAPSQIVVTDRLESAGYVAITRQVMTDFDVDAPESEPDRYWQIPTPQTYRSREYAVEGDWSQAAFPLLMGMLSGPVSLCGLRQDSAQGDRVILDIFRSMGGRLQWQGDRLLADRSTLTACDVDVSQCPDLSPAIAAAMALARGKSSIVGGRRLRDKESDRIASITACLNALGADVKETQDGMMIAGRPDGLRGGRADGCNDHRVAMMAAAVSPACGQPITLTDADSVAKSWPRFWQDFATLGGVTQ